MNPSAHVGWTCGQTERRVMGGVTLRSFLMIGAMNRWEEEVRQNSQGEDGGSLQLLSLHFLLFLHEVEFVNILPASARFTHRP